MLFAFVLGAGRGGLALTLVSQYDVAIFKQIEELIGKQLQEFPCKEDTVRLINTGANWALATADRDVVLAIPS